jgi:hypothetical protein
MLAAMLFRTLRADFMRTVIAISNQPKYRHIVVSSSAQKLLTFLVGIRVSLLDMTGHLAS